MKTAYLLLTTAATLVGLRGEGTPAPSPAPVEKSAPLRPAAPPRAWLGFQIRRPDLDIAAQLPDLPKGIGFVVHSISPGGPAAAAGVEEADLVWKLGDQLLANEGQLAVLLRLHKPGEETRLSLFRAGKAVELTIKLGVAPERSSSSLTSLAESSIFPSECGPMRVVNLAQKSASYSSEEGKAEVKMHDGGFRIVITKLDGTKLHDVSLNTPDDFHQLPNPWRRRAYALRRGLEQALASPPGEARPSRPRIVSPQDAPLE